MAHRDNGHTTLLVPVAACAFAVAAWSIPRAEAFDSNVVWNCTSDYMAYCSAHSVNSTATRVCMEENRAKLSAECKQALIAAGEVPHKYLGNKKKE